MKEYNLNPKKSQKKGGINNTRYLIIKLAAASITIMTVFIMAAGLLCTHAEALTTFFDDTFNDSDWTRFAEHQSGPLFFEETAEQRTSGGNPGAYRHMTHYWGSGTQVFVFHLNNNAIYDPSAQGAIVSINYSADIIGFYYSPNFGVFGDGILIEQDGRLFRTVTQGNPFNNLWQTKSFTGLTADNFTALDDLVSHPDFSSAGSPIKFGYIRANTIFTTPATLSHGIDNWSVTISTVPIKQEILNYQTGFEAPTYVPGPLAGQDDWIVYSGLAEISTTNPKSGDQSIEVLGDWLDKTMGYVIWASHRRIFDYDTLANGTPVIEASVDVRLDGPDTGQGPAHDLLSVNLVVLGRSLDGFPSLGDMILSSTGQVFIFGSTGSGYSYLGQVPAEPGKYHRIGTQTDFITRTTHFFVDGDFILSLPLNPLITTNILRRISLAVGALNDPNYINVSDYTAYYDNLSVRAVVVDSTKARFTLFYRDHFASDRLSVTGYLNPKLEKMPFDKDVTVEIKLPDPRNSADILTVINQTIPAGTVSGRKTYRFSSREPGIQSLKLEPRTDSTRISVSVDDVDLLPDIRAGSATPEEYLELIRSIEYYVITLEIDGKLWSGLSHLKPTTRTKQKQELKLQR
jgi:hypothetical protein